MSESEDASQPESRRVRQSRFLTTARGRLVEDDPLAQDTSDAEWAVRAPHVPAGDRPRPPARCGLTCVNRSVGRSKDATRNWALHDSGYAGRLVGWAAEQLTLTVHIATKRAGQTTFVVLRRKWAVERRVLGKPWAAGSTLE
jgi:hypothetical protein